MKDIFTQDELDKIGEDNLIKKAKEIYGDKYPEHEQDVMVLIQQRRNLQKALKNLSVETVNPENYQVIIEKFDLYPQSVDRLVMETAIPDLKDNVVTLLHYIGLSGEVGELGEKIKKSVRDNYKIEQKDPAIAKELGDIAWYLFRLVSDYGFSMNEILQMNYDKLSKRLQTDNLHGSGDDREE